MPNTHPLQLTLLESLYLSDALSMFTQGPPDALPGEASPYPNLLLKVGGAVLEAEQKKAPVVIHVTLNELWMVREVAKSSVMMGSERVGLNLLLKVYAGIRALTAESDMEAVIGDLGEVAEEEPGKNEYTSQLEQIKDSGNFKNGGSQR